MASTLLVAPSANIGPLVALIPAMDITCDENPYKIIASQMLLQTNFWVARFFVAWCVPFDT
jgi:hypothetical protein